MFKKISFCTVFIFSFFTNPVFAQNIEKPQSGSYVWKHSGGCGYLTIDRKSTYKWDEKCDGTVDYTGNKVRVTRKKITIDAATFKYSNVSPTKISGEWKLFDFVENITFVKTQ